MNTSTHLPSLQDIEAAAEVVYRDFAPTPLYRWALLSERLGTDCWLKHENHTPVGAQAGLQCLVVEVKPAFCARCTLGNSFPIDSNDLQVGTRKSGGVDGNQPVVGAHQRVFATRAGHHAQRGFAPGHALGQAGGQHHQVVHGIHKFTAPSMQVTDAPPTHTWPLPSRSTHTRPARSRQVPWAAR